MERNISIMSKEIENTTGGHLSPFERIKRTSDAGVEYWSSRKFADVLGYGNYRNFEGVLEKAKLSCFNSGHRLEDHFVDINEMIEVGSRRSLGVGTTGRDSSVAPLSRNDTTAVVISTPSVSLTSCHFDQREKSNVWR